MANDLRPPITLASSLMTSTATPELSAVLTTRIDRAFKYCCGYDPLTAQRQGQAI